MTKSEGLWGKGLGLGSLVVVGLAAAGWFSLDKETRAVVAAMPTDADLLFWSVEQRDAGFRALDRFPWLAQARIINAGDRVRALPPGAPLDMAMDMNAYMAGQRASAIVILLDGELVFERYGLDFEAEGRWTSFSVAKSLTSTLVGAAIKDGAINSLDDKVTLYIPDLAGSAYDDVTIRQLLTMSSGVRWNEDYSNPESDVARFNAHVPEDGLDATVSYMRGLDREAPPGERWVYKTGETNLVGVLVSQATGSPLAEYLSEKIWAPFGMEQDATWLLGPTGHEISGCCIQATTRDMARFGQFILEGGVSGGIEVLPDWWLGEATSTHYATNRARRSYGYQWWTYGDGSFAAGGIFGQGIFIDPVRNLVIASNANWPLATDDDGTGKERDLFYHAVQAAVDARIVAGVRFQD